MGSCTSAARLADSEGPHSWSISMLYNSLAVSAAVSCSAVQPQQQHGQRQHVTYSIGSRKC
jgi:hypothetical protein